MEPHGTEFPQKGILTRVGLEVEDSLLCDAVIAQGYGAPA